MCRWSTSFPSFLIPNYLVTTWSPEHNYLGGRITVFPCSVIPSPTVGYPKIFFHNPPLFSTPLQLHTDLSASWQGSQYIDILHPSKYYLHLRSPPSHNLDGKHKQDRYFPQWSGVLRGVSITKDQMLFQNQSRLYNDIYVFAYASPYYYTRTKFYSASLQQEANQTHHPISQNVMLMNQFSSPPPS